MLKKLSAIMFAVILGAAVLTGCGGNNAQQAQGATEAATEAVTEAAEEVTEAATEAATEGATEAATEAVTEAAEEVTEAAETEAATEEELIEEAAEAPLPDGVYLADFNTDSSMFHVNEAKEGKGILTVKDGQMTIHITLVSKNIVNLFPGLAEDAQKDGAELLEPTDDEVTYSDGITEEVYGFDVPVPALDEEFDCALLGTKGTWYDHKVSVSNPEPYEE